MKARVFRRLNEGKNLRSGEIVYVSLLLDQMMKNVRASNLSGVMLSIFK